MKRLMATIAAMVGRILHRVQHRKLYRVSAERKERGRLELELRMERQRRALGIR